MNFVWLCVYDIILYKVSEENKVMLLPGYLLDLLSDVEESVTMQRELRGFDCTAVFYIAH